MTHTKLSMRLAVRGDLDRLQVIRELAFAPVFASFQSILGDTVYDHAQAHEDEAQSGLLDAMLEPQSEWTVHVAELDSEIVGFVAVRLDTDRSVGEIGLNAIHPLHCGQGLGTQLYQFALDEMKRAGIRVATVATGGDPSHAPARRAYQKAGFNIEIPSVWLCKEL